MIITTLVLVNTIYYIFQFFQETHRLKTVDGSKIRIKQHLYQGADLRRAIPPVTAMHQDVSFVPHHLVAAPQRRHQHFGDMI